MEETRADRSLPWCKQREAAPQSAKAFCAYMHIPKNPELDLIGSPKTEETYSTIKDKRAKKREKRKEKGKKEIKGTLKKDTPHRNFEEMNPREKHKKP